MTHPTVAPPLAGLADHSYDPEVLVLAADLAEVAAERDQAERDRDHRAAQVSDLLVDMANAHQREQDLKDQVHSLLLALGAAERELAQLREGAAGPVGPVRTGRSYLAAAA